MTGRGVSFLCRYGFVVILFEGCSVDSTFEVGKFPVMLPRSSGDALGMFVFIVSKMAAFMTDTIFARLMWRQGCSVRVFLVGITAGGILPTLPWGHHQPASGVCHSSGGLYPGLILLYSSMNTEIWIFCADWQSRGLPNVRRMSF